MHKTTVYLFVIFLYCFLSHNVVSQETNSHYTVRFSKTAFYYGDEIKVVVRENNALSDDSLPPPVGTESGEIIENNSITAELYWRKNAGEENESLVMISSHTFSMERARASFAIPTRGWNETLWEMLLEKHGHYFEELFCAKVYVNDQLITQKDDIFIAGVLLSE